MDECRVICLGVGYGFLLEVELEVVFIIVKCLEGMKVVVNVVDFKNDFYVFIELYKLGFVCLGDVEFEDFS